MELEETLQHLLKWCQWTYLIQRPFNYDDATLVNIEDVSHYVDQYNEGSDITATLDKYTDGIKKREWLESIRGHMNPTKGVIGVPIAYAIRTDSPLPAVHPGPGLPNFDTELLTRGRHTAFFWASDNRKVWNIIQKLCRHTSAWSLIAPFEGAMNGRMAYRALVRQFMGPDARHLLMQQAGTIINDSRFDNKSRNFSFDKFCARFRQALIDFGPNDQMSPEMTVVKIMDAWRVQELMHLAAIIFSSDKYKFDLEETITFLATNLRTLQTSHKPKGRNVGAYEQKNDGYQPKKQKGGPKGGSKGGKGKKFTGHKKWTKSSGKSSKGYDPQNPGQYVKLAVWNSWTDEEKAAAREDRRKKGIGSSAQTSNISSIKTQKSTVRFVDDAKVHIASDTETEEDEDEEAQPSKKRKTNAFNSSKVTQSKSGKPTKMGN